MPIVIATLFAAGLLALAVYLPAIRAGLSDLKRQAKSDMALGCEQ